MGALGIKWGWVWTAIAIILVVAVLNEANRQLGKKIGGSLEDDDWEVQILERTNNSIHFIADIGLIAFRKRASLVQEGLRLVGNSTEQIFFLQCDPDIMVPKNALS